MTNGHGGRRENAGRKTGALTTRSRMIAEKAIESGTTPLDVMIKNMRFADEQGSEVLAKIMQTEEGASVDSLKELLGFRRLAQDCAKDAAPYVHPRIATVELTGKDGKDLMPENDPRDLARAVLDILRSAKLDGADAS